MSDLFADLKLHAEKLHKDIKILENTYEYPAGFYGTTSRSASANVILKNELQTVRNLHGNFQEQLGELQESIRENSNLLLEVEKVTDDLNNLTKLLGEFGFSFSVNNETPADSKENGSQDVPDNGNFDAETNVDQDVLLIGNHIDAVNIHENHDLCSDIASENLGDYIEKYLEDNHIELEDIVTPYIPRKSLFGGKKT